jgi:hypothetical protein
VVAGVVSAPIVIRLFVEVVMKRLMMLAAVAAALSVTGCKKKSDDAAPAATGSGATAAAPKTAEPTPAVAGKSCEELGGRKDGDRCTVKTPAPFEAVFTGKFDTNMYRDEPGAVFKVTNKTNKPMKIDSAQLYAYDKDGKQLELTFADGSKGKYAQDSKMGLLDLDAGQTKEYIHSIGKKNLPAEMDTVQVEFLAWESADGKEVWGRDIPDFDNRPKDGWK